jgi:hypothetical protein
MIGPLPRKQLQGFVDYGRVGTVSNNLGARIVGPNLGSDACRCFVVVT